MNDSANLTCRETTWLVCGARDVTLTSQQQAQLARHLQGCTACTIASRQFAEMFSQLDNLLARG